MLNHNVVMCRPGIRLEPSAPPAPVMSYQCRCGRKWYAPGPNSLKDGAYRWICSCGVALILRNRVIFAPATELGVVPASIDRLQRWVARGGWIAMNRPGANAYTSVTVLSYEPNGTDQAALESIFGAAEWPLPPGLQWKLETVANARSACAAIRSAHIPLVICGCDTHPEMWKKMLGKIGLLPNPPLLIVTSRLADDRLWVEALNLGAYDVLAKPYDCNEVVRAFSCAWLRWQGHPAAAAAAAPMAQVMAHIRGAAGSR